MVDVVDSMVDDSKEEIEILDGHEREGGLNSGSSDSSFAFSNLRFIVQSAETKETRKDKRNKFRGRDYRRLLEKAERREEKLGKMEPGKKESVSRNIAWERAFRRAAGQKVKDNKELLKKGLKRKEKSKQRKKQKWEDRKQTVEAAKEWRMEKRRENIEKRKEQQQKKNKMKGKGGGKKGGRRK